MSLLQRLHARRCRFIDCQEDRVPDSQLCREHMGDLWANRLDRVDGVYVPRRRFPAVDRTWERAT